MVYKSHIYTVKSVLENEYEILSNTMKYLLPGMGLTSSNVAKISLTLNFRNRSKGYMLSFSYMNDTVIKLLCQRFAVYRQPSKSIA